MTEVRGDDVFSNVELSRMILGYCEMNFLRNWDLRRINQTWRKLQSESTFEYCNARELSFLNKLVCDEVIGEEGRQSYSGMVRRINIYPDDYVLGSSWNAAREISFNNLEEIRISGIPKDEDLYQDENWEFEISHLDSVLDSCSAAREVSVDLISSDNLRHVLAILKPKLLYATFRIGISDYIKMASSDTLTEILRMLSPEENDGRQTITDFTITLDDYDGISPRSIFDTITMFPWLWTSFTSLEIDIFYYSDLVLSEDLDRIQPFAPNLKNLSIDLPRTADERSTPIATALLGLLRCCTNLTWLTIYINNGPENRLDDQWVRETLENKHDLCGLTLSCISWGEPTFTVNTLLYLKRFKNMDYLDLQNKLYIDHVRDDDDPIVPHEDKEALRIDYETRNKLVKNNDQKIPIDFSRLGSIDEEVAFPNLESFDIVFDISESRFAKDVMRHHMPLLDNDHPEDWQN